MTATDTAVVADLDEAPPAGPTGPPPVDDAPQGRSGGSIVKALLAMAVVAAAMAALVLFVANRDQPGVAEAYEVVVATDAGQGIVDGSGDDVVPALIRLQPGQALVLENDDWGPHTLASLTAERGQTVRVAYPTEGRHITSTTLRADGRVTILVEDTTP